MRLEFTTIVAHFLFPDSLQHVLLVDPVDIKHALFYLQGSLEPLICPDRIPDPAEAACGGPVWGLRSSDGCTGRYDGLLVA